MTDTDPTKNLDLQLEPSGPGGEASPGGEEGPNGQWVWQFAASPPPPSFGAMFFSGHAGKDHYRFFACAVLVIVGCFLPWGPVAGPDGVVAPLVIEAPEVLGVETPAGAVSLLLGLWLLFAACHGVYTGNHKILPVFLMIEPAIVTWLRAIDAWGQLPGDDTLQKIQDVFVVGGTGVMLTLLGSTWVAAGFLLLLGKVYTKKDDKGAARRSTPRVKKDSKKDAKKDSGSSKGKRGKAATKATKGEGDAGADAGDGGGDGAPKADDSDAKPIDAGELEELPELDELTPDDEVVAADSPAESPKSSDEGAGSGGSSRRGGSRGRRGRRR